MSANINNYSLWSRLEISFSGRDWNNGGTRPLEEREKGQKAQSPRTKLKLNLGSSFGILL